MDIVSSNSEPRYTAEIFGGGEFISPVYKIDNHPVIEIMHNTNHKESVVASGSGAILVLFDLGKKNYLLKMPIYVRLESDGEVYIANFADAEITTSGDTAEEAIRWLQDSIVDTFELFSAQQAVLGPLPKRQLKALEKYVGKEQARKA